MESLLRIPTMVPDLVLQSPAARLILPGIVAIFGFVLATIGASKVFDHRRAVANFEAVDAVIVESQLDTGPERTSRTYMPSITYEYTYAGDDYECSVVHPGGTWATGNEDRMKSIVDQYRPGDRVTAYCDPENPQDAYLREGKTWHAYLALGIGTLVVLLMAAIGSTVF